MVPIGDVLDLYANLWVFPHPLDLLTDGRKGVETGSYRIKRKMDRDDVGLVVVGASQPAQIGSLQNLDTVNGTQFVNQHVDCRV